MPNKFLLFCISTPLLFASYFTNAGADNASLMKPVSYQQWVKARESYLPNIVVVDMWAMWCISCIEQFPDMVKMHEHYKNSGVVFTSMNLDDRDDPDSLSDASAFLSSMNAEFDHYRMDENLMTAFEQTNLIGIPAVLIYDAEGNERFRLTGDNPNKQFTELDIEQAIKSLINTQ